MGYSVAIWLAVAVVSSMNVITNVSGKDPEVVTASNHGVVMCVTPSPDKEQVKWKNSSTEHKLFLTTDNVVCYFTRKCFQKNSTEEDVIIQANHVIQLELQEGDWLVLHVNLSMNESSEEAENMEVVLDPVPEREAVSCNLAVLPIEAMAHWKVGVIDNI
ncbi:hypothetical protein X975_07714, partial [Stegodyphus mimosarum]